MRVGDIWKGDKVETQIQWETHSALLGAQRYRRLADDAIERGEGSSLKPAERLLRHWYPAVVEAITDEIRSCVRGEQGVGRSVYGPILTCLDAERSAVIAISTVLSETLRHPSGAESRSMTHSIGANIIAEIHHDMIKADSAASLRDLDRRFKRKTAARVNWWAKRTLEDHFWSRAACIHMGAALVVLVMRSSPVNDWDDDNWIPAFEKKTVYRDNKPNVVIKMSDQAKEKIEDGHTIRQYMRPRYQPMIVEPFPWACDRPGGYVRHRVPMVTRPSPATAKTIASADPVFFEAFNAVQSQPYKICKWTLGVIQQVWADGGGAGLLPDADLIPLPPKPQNIKDDKAVLKSWKLEASEVYAANARMAGQRTTFIQNLQTAEELSEVETIYLPIKACGRSRTYPIPLFNHHLGDVTRSLFLSGTPKPHDTPAAQRAICIHLSNCWGFDKADLDSRVEYAMDMMSQATAIGRDPLDNIDHWSKADDPWQFLTACRATVDPEIAAHILCTADGTCNGLQHLGAAGRDEVGGALVNLTPSDVPNDLYSEVCAVALEEIVAEAAGGEPTAKEVIRMGLLDLSKGGRTLCKRPGMTKSYRVSAIGVRDQLRDQLKKDGMGPREASRIANYLGKYVQDAVGDRCPKANEIMDWLVDCGRMMIKAKPYVGLHWTTPLGWEVVQPYRMRPRRHLIKTLLQEFNLGHVNDDCLVAKRKQLNAFTANVVHSLDATHKLLVALRCKDSGMAFTDVFDLFGTNADDMEKLHHVLREEFVLMHEENILGNMWSAWCDEYGIDLPPPPPPGQLDLNDVMKSDFFFH